MLVEAPLCDPPDPKGVAMVCAVFATILVIAQVEKAVTLRQMFRSPSKEIDHRRKAVIAQAMNGKATKSVAGMAHFENRKIVTVLFDLSQESQFGRLQAFLQNGRFGVVPIIHAYGKPSVKFEHA